MSRGAAQPQAVPAAPPAVMWRVAARQLSSRLQLLCCALSVPVTLLSTALVGTPGRATAQRAVRILCVHDGTTGRAVDAARVLLVTGRDTVLFTTDARGVVSVPAAQLAEAMLQVRRLGFAPALLSQQRLAAVAGGDTIRISLTPLALALDATVVTAARREQRLADAVVPVELISRRQIEETGSTDVASVLTERLGIQLDRGLPGNSGVQLQGLGSQRVLVLVDGQPLVGRIGGTLDLSRLSASNVERIEVVKGPQSTLYGSDAMGGVINIVTRRPESGGMDARLQAVGGSMGRSDLLGTALGSYGATDVVLDVGQRRLALAPGVTDAAATFADRYDVAPSVAWRGANGLTVQAGGLFTGERQRYRTGPLFRFVDRDQLAARVGGEYVRNRHRIGALLYRSRFDHLARASTFDTPQGDLGDRDRQQLTELEVTYAGPTPIGQLDAGLEVRRESIVADRVQGMRQHWDLVEPFAQVGLVFGRVAVTPGVRYTQNSQWGSAFAPRLAALWQASELVRVRASAGRGFRAPDFKELFLSFANAQAGYAVVGNPRLQPETSENVQLHAERVGVRTFVRASVFTNRLEQFIQFAAGEDPGVFSYENVDRAWTRGAEMESGFTHDRWRVEGGYSFLRTRDLGSGLELLSRPRHSGRLSVSAGNLVGGRMAATLVYTGATTTGRNELGVTTAQQPTFTRLDLRGARPIGAGLELSVGVDNAFNRSLGADWPGYTGRLWYAGLSWQAVGGAR
jgi:outer membrane receptor for ferrienterochelin and colicins